MISELIQRRGTVFDIAAFLANICLIYPLASLVKRTQGFDPVFAGLLLAAAGLQAVGAHLKRRPMHARLATQNVPEMGGWGYLLFMTLGIMHYAVFAMCILAGLEGLGLNGKLGAAEPFLVMGGALLPSIMAIFALIPPRIKEQPTPTLRRRESAGELLLYFSTVVILAWWDGFWVEYLATADLPNVWMSLLLFVLCTVPFAVFYLAPRLVMLREDYMRKQTWLNATIVMLPLATRLLFRG